MVRRGSWRWATAVGLATSCMLASASAQSPPDQSAKAMFSEARAALTDVAPAARAEYLEYLAAQERAAGLDGRGDWLAAFSAALALPREAGAVKSAAELSVIDDLVDGGDWATAESLALEADSGRSQIFDRLVPAELNADRGQQAWRIWRENRDEVGYRSYTVLLDSSQSHPEERQELCSDGLRRAVEVADLAQIELARRFLSRCSSSGLSARTSVASALIGLAARLGSAPGQGWEIAATRGRLRTSLQGIDARLLSGFDSAASLPPLGESRRSEAGGGYASGAVMPLPTFVALARSAIATWNPQFQAVSLHEALRSLSPATAAGWPIATVYLAVGSYELKHTRDMNRALALATDEASQRANRAKWGTRISLSGSAVLAVFGAAAEIDFPGTRARAESLRPGPMKILVLAHVARMARVAARLRPGQLVTLLH